MSTRSEIRFYKKGKLKGCTYQHSDGYPETILSEVGVLGSSGNSGMQKLSKMSGSGHTKCSHPTKHQGDIEFSYEVGLSEYDYPNKVKIHKHPFEGKKKKIFDGNFHEAHKKWVCDK